MPEVGTVLSGMGTEQQLQGFVMALSSASSVLL
jgi:hypothetical protein